MTQSTSKAPLSSLPGFYRISQDLSHHPDSGTASNLCLTVKPKRPILSPRFKQYLGYTFLPHPTMFKAFTREEESQTFTCIMHPKSKSLLLPILLLLSVRYRTEQACVSLLLKKQILMILPSSPSQLSIPTVISQALAFKYFWLWPIVKYLHPNPVHKYMSNIPSLNGNSFQMCDPLWWGLTPKLRQFVLNPAPTPPLSDLLGCGQPQPEKGHPPLFLSSPKGEALSSVSTPMRFI